MLRRRVTPYAALHKAETSTFDRVTLTSFVATVALSAGVLLGYGPADALNHIAEVILAGLRDMPAPDPVMWNAQMVF